MLESLTNVAARRIKPVARFHMKTRQLTLLVHLDDKRCLVRAAEAAGLTQPAASKLLRQIESALDVKLFERQARGMQPTSYGEILIRHARQALSELGLAREEIAALKSGLSGKVALGIVFDPKSTLVPLAIARMKQRHPGVLVRIESDTSRELIQRLLQGELDMVVGRVLDSRLAAGLTYEPLAADEPHAIIAGGRHPLAGRALQISSLIEQPWILPPAGSLLRDKLTAMFVQLGLPLPSNIVEAVSLPVITTLLQQSNLVTALPEEAVQSSCKAGNLTVLVRKLPLEVESLGLITRGDLKLSSGAQLMLRTLRELAGERHPVESRDSGGLALAKR
jgi:DNA-binding transcriptional LysR family regulator